jgi:GT2 family glycosyltransferase
MQLSIIIINYNTFALTCKCIASIVQHCTGISYQIVLVDNASTECPPDLFLQTYPKLTLVKSPINTGFTGGNNLGIQHATGTHILLLNSDTELLNNAPKICYDTLLANPNVGLITCKLTYPNGQIQHNVRRFRTITWEILQVLPFYKLLPKKLAEAVMLHNQFSYNREITCDWVWGTFMLFPKSILAHLPNGQLNNAFFMYAEDVLWCLEIKQLGYQIMFTPNAQVMHLHKGSSSKEKLRKIFLHNVQNHAQVMRKYYPNYKWYIFAAIFKAKQYAFFGIQKLMGRL